MHTMIGTVNELFDGWFIVSCPAPAPIHIQSIYLTSQQLHGAKIGDRVELTYTATPSSGLWAVSRVLDHATLCPRCGKTHQTKAARAACSMREDR